MVNCYCILSLYYEIMFYLLDMKRLFRTCVVSIFSLGTISTVFQYRFEPTKLGVTRVDLVMDITRFKVALLYVFKNLIHISQRGYMRKNTSLSYLCSIWFPILWAYTK